MSRVEFAAAIRRMQAVEGGCHLQMSVSLDIEESPKESGTPVSLETVLAEGGDA